MAIRTSWTTGEVLTSTDLTDTFGSKLTTPPAWTSYTPSWTNLTIGNATQSCKYIQAGKIVHAQIYMTWGSTTSASGFFYPSLPVTAANSIQVNAAGFLFDNSGAVWNACVFVAGNYILTPSSGRVSATVPWTWATSDIVSINVTYEAA